MYCETCPIRDHCKAYEAAEEDNKTLISRQDVVRVQNWYEPPCPLLKLIKPEEE